MASVPIVLPKSELLVAAAPEIRTPRSLPEIKLPLTVLLAVNSPTPSPKLPSALVPPMFVPMKFPSIKFASASHQRRELRPQSSQKLRSTSPNSN